MFTVAAGPRVSLPGSQQHGTRFGEPDVPGRGLSPWQVIQRIERDCGVCVGKRRFVGQHNLRTRVSRRTTSQGYRAKDVRTTMIYTHVLNRGGRGVRSPADGLAFRPDER